MIGSHHFIKSTNQGIARLSLVRRTGQWEERGGEMNDELSTPPLIGWFFKVMRSCHTQFRHCIITPWCRVLLEKLPGLQLVKKFPAFHGTRKFITAFTSFRHPSLSWTSPIQSTCPQPTSWRSILILSTHLRLGLPSGLFPSGFPTRAL